MVTMSRLELEWRRRRLSLTRIELGRYLMLVSGGVLDHPVSESTIKRWEQGKVPPYDHVPLAEYYDRLDELAAAIDREAYRVCSEIEPVDGVAVLPGFHSDPPFWRMVPKLNGWPYTLWNRGVVAALTRLRRERPDVDYRMGLLG